MGLIILKKPRMSRNPSPPGRGLTLPKPLSLDLLALCNGLSASLCFETFFPKPPDNDFPDPTDNYKKSRWKKFNNPLTNLQDSVFLSHDIVLLKFSQIDEASLKFWRSLVRQFGTNGNPFSEPANLVTNIDGGLGCWTGNAPSY